MSAKSMGRLFIAGVLGFALAHYEGGPIQVGLIVMIMWAYGHVCEAA